MRKNQERVKAVVIKTKDTKFTNLKREDRHETTMRGEKRMGGRRGGGKGGEEGKGEGGGEGGEKGK